jgi:glycosyltransferase involved in cell wall biosynthesis
MMGPVLWCAERFSPRWLQGQHVLTEAEHTAALLQELGARPGFVHRIPPGVDTSLFAPNPDARSDVPLLLFVGRLKRYKRVDLALRAFALVRASQADVRFIVVGKGDDFERLQGIARKLDLLDSVEFLGYVADAEIPNLYQKAWVNLQPSAAEGWGLTINEAAAAGTPTVGFACGVMPESVGPINRPYLVESESDKAFAEKVIKCLSDMRHNRFRIESALAAATARRSWERVADEYVTLFEQVIDKPSAPFNISVSQSRHSLNQIFPRHDPTNTNGMFGGE